MFTPAALTLTSSGELASAQVLPNGVKPTCTISPAEFASWFKMGAVAANGVVNPADSINFRSLGNGGFYKWAEQMFLWLTSPAADGGRIFESPAFYNISMPALDGSRILLPNMPRKHSIMTVGQSGGSHVLMAQNKSLVYYAIQVNDVYAYFLTAEKNHQIFPRPTGFPTTREELKIIIAFAESHGTKLSYPDTLVVELKSAWVETDGLDPNKYITMTATIPNFNTSDPTKWIPNGSKQAQLALVGMHIVGSAAGHPEMIWATFEHIGNAPVAPYPYNDTNDQIVETAASVSGPWLFSRTNSSGPFNIPNMHYDNAPIIEAFPGKTIKPSDTRRENAWGSSPNDPGRARKNTEIIAINRSTIGMLADDDVRKNYLLLGATWSLGLGARRLANTTMETYQQDKNAFVCHNGNPLDGRLSFIYGPLKPLFQ
jgi:hypothetical protein